MSAPVLKKPCQFCHQTFPSTSLLIAHEKQHFRGYKEIKINSSISHQPMEEKPKKNHQCPHCELGFSYKCNLNRHVKQVHPNPAKTLTCEVCKKHFSTKASLKSHAAIHDTDKPYKCQICWKSYWQFGQLESHVYVDHTLKKDWAKAGEEPLHKIHFRSQQPQKIKLFPSKPQTDYQCEIVEEVVTKKKPYQCNVCDMSSDTIEEMRIHIKMHLN